MTGLYEIVHRPTGRAYIGSSVDVDRRLRAHRGMLKRDAHFNCGLQVAWNRDGARAFDFRGLEPCREADLRSREAEVIAKREGLLFNTSSVVQPGARAPNASLADAQVRAIFDRAAAGESTTALADEFGVSYHTVRRIVAGRTYRDVTGGQRARGRVFARGVNAGLSKLNPESVRAIRRRWKDGRLVGAGHPDTSPSLAAEFGVATQTIYLVRERKVWAHID